MKATLTPWIAAIALTGLTFGQAAQAQVTLEATRTITTGCSFGSPLPGTLGASANMQTLSTEISGSRPSFTMNVIGNAVLSQTGGITWKRDSTVLSGITSSHNLRKAVTGGAIEVLPATYSTSGARTLYMEVAGTHATEFMTAGNYVASATFTCV